MTGPCFPSQIAVGNYCLTAFASILALYASVLDPRPDLAVPARRVRLPYAWWW